MCRLGVGNSSVTWLILNHLASVTKPYMVMKVSKIEFHVILHYFGDWVK
jgi:hypothetical protein